MVIDQRKKKKRAWQITFGIIGVLAMIILIPIANAGLDLYNAGAFDKANKKDYDATSMKNMRALWQATMLYYDAEGGVMPHASGWMDAAKPFLVTADLKDGEEMKKLSNPNLAAGPGVFGYAMNFDLSEAYLDELEDPEKTPMIFDSSDTSWNAFGLPMEIAPNPELPGGNRAVTVEGVVVELNKLLNKDEE